MRCLQKLVRNGNSTQVTIPRQLLIHLGWLPGENVIVDLLEDGEVRLTKFELPKRAAAKPAVDAASALAEAKL